MIKSINLFLIGALAAIWLAMGTAHSDDTPEPIEGFVPLLQYWYQSKGEWLYSMTVPVPDYLIPFVSSTSSAPVWRSRSRCEKFLEDRVVQLTEKYPGVEGVEATCIAATDFLTPPEKPQSTHIPLDDSAQKV